MSRDPPSPGADAAALPWLEEPWARVSALLEAERMPHALLLFGPAGIGKRAFAARIAGAVLCEGPPPRPCGACRSCHLFSVGNHPDLRRLAPEEGAAGIRIGPVRALVEHSALTSGGGAKVAIAAPAEAMNPAAANTFLKTLEEPPGRTVFLLVSDAPGMVLPTIRSRCRKMALPAPPRAAALAWLEAAGAGGPDAAGRLLDLAGGMPLAALDLSRRHEREALESLHGTAAALFEGKADPLDAAEGWRKAGDPRLVLSVLFSLLGALARRGAPDPDRLYAAVDALAETRRQWTEVPGLNELLVYEGLALRCAGLAAPPPP